MTVANVVPGVTIVSVHVSSSLLVVSGVTGDVDSDSGQAGKDAGVFNGTSTIIVAGPKHPTIIFVVVQHPV